jgi:autotransporter-associated beta strand protein
LGDTSGSQTWTLASGGGVLTLDSGSSASPSIMINNSTATLGVSLAGTNGFTKSGAGILVLAGANSLSGTVNIDTSAASGNGGAVRASYSSSLAAVDTVQIRNNNSGYSTLQFDGTQHGDVVVPAGVVLSGRNVNVAAIQNMGGNNVLSGGINIGVGGGYYVIQSDAGMLELGGTITSAATGTRTFTFQGTGDGLVSGRIENGSADAVNVVKSGAGKWTLAGTETYTGTTTVSGGELMVNGTTGAGATTVASGATLSGGGTVNSNLIAQTGSRIRIGGQGFPLGPDTAFALIDSFQSYPFGANGTTLTPAWVPGFPAGGANSSSTQIGADTGSGQALRYLHGGSGGQINHAAMGTIAAEGSTGTLFFQVALTATGSDTLFAFGRPGAAAYGDLASLFRVPSDLIVEVHDAGYVNTSTSISLNTLYNFWVVIDNRANTSSLYYSTGTNAPTLIQSGYAFRSSTAGDINTFYLGSNSGSAGFLDNIHIDPTGDNRTNPLDVTEMAPRAATLHVANDFTLSSGTTLEFDVSSSDLYDRLVVGGQFNASGTLKVTFDPEQPAPWSGDTFDLFDSAGGTINFATLDLPALAPGLAWDTNSVGSGVLNVVQSVATHPTNLVPFVSNNVLTLSWPKDHTGWRLETQTNSPGAGISTHWMTVPGSDLTNEMSLPINPANGSAFFRLVHP